MKRQHFSALFLVCFILGRCFDAAAWGETAASIEFRGDVKIPQIAFAVKEILQSAIESRSPQERLVVTFRVDEKTLPAQAYRIERVEGPRNFLITGGDPTGAMYGGLDLAEAIRIGMLEELSTKECRPYIERRGIKFNIPLDLRTPSYSDNGDSFQANIPEVWSKAFWYCLLYTSPCP